ncbi:MAG: alpha/beta hydrolase family protein [Endomicrobiales bacterium]
MLKTPELCGNGQTVNFSAERVRLEGRMVLPGGAREMVIMANGGSESRNGAQNRQIACLLNRYGMATFLVNLFTVEEEVLDRRAHHLRFNVGLLAKRLQDATEWAMKQNGNRIVSLAYFGAGTCASAALVAASRRTDIAALVSATGRPDLAGTALRRVRVPSLFIVGGSDFPMLDIHRETLKGIMFPKKLAIVPGAARHFRKTGEIREAALLAAEWFRRHMRTGRNAGPGSALKLPGAAGRRGDEENAARAGRAAFSGRRRKRLNRRIKDESDEP